MNNIVITKYKNYICSGFFHDFTLMECDLSPEDDSGILVGDVYVGYVENIVKSINAAFVRIKPGVNGYYSLDANQSHLFLSPKNNHNLAIGDKILVQVKSEAIKSKPFSLSGSVCVPGVYCVAVSDSDTVMVSQRIHDKERIAVLKETLAPITAKGGVGLIVRTSAENAPLDKVTQEAKTLTDTLRGLLENAVHQALYTKVLGGNASYEKYVHDYAVGTADKVITDIPQVYEKLQHCAGITGLTLELYKDSYPLKSLYNFERQLEKALQPKVWLDCGGFLIIEPTEALTVIDVNSGKYQGKKSDMGAANYKINLEAAKEIARQLRLRNLSGIVIVDFINMPDEAQKRQLVEALSSYILPDKITTTVVDITSLGLVELTRKKVKKPLHEVLGYTKNNGDNKLKI